MNIQEESERILRDYFRVLRRRWKLIAGVTGALVVVVFAGSHALPEVYVAQATIQIDPRTPNFLGMDSLDPMEARASSQRLSRFYRTQYRILRSRKVGHRAAQSLIDDEVEGFSGLAQCSIDPEQALVEEAEGIKCDKAWGLVREGLSIMPEQDSNLVAIRFEHTNARSAAAAANAVADAYIRVNRNRSVEQVQDGLDDLDEQREEYNRERGRSQEEAQLAKVDLQLIAGDETGHYLMRNLEDLQARWSEATTDKVESEAEYQSLLSIARSEGKLALARVLDEEGSGMQQLLLEHGRLSQARDSLATRYKPGMPAMQEAEANVAASEARIVVEVDKVIGAAHTRYKLAEQQEVQLKDELDSLRTDVAEVESRLDDLRAKEAAAERATLFFETLATRATEVQTSQAVWTDNVWAVDYALPPAKPDRPKPFMNAVMALLAGLFGGSVLALILEYLDFTVRPGDYERSLGIQHLGSIPMLRAEDLKRSEAIPFPSIVVHAMPKSTVAEVMRMVRTNIQLTFKGRQLKRLLVTSSAPREGKSFMSSNLASIFAGSGRVLLIDADMRKPTIHRVFGLDNERGLSEVLQGKASFAEVIRPSHVPNLSLVTAGSTPDNPVELLEAMLTEELLEQLSHFDMVIFDSPPVSAVADPMIIAAMVDGVVLVVEVNKTRRGMARMAGAQIAKVNANLVGAIVNKEPERDWTVGYGYGYGYGGYGYNKAGYYRAGYGGEPSGDADSKA